MPYLENLTVPILDANIDVSGEPRLQGQFNKSMILERGGEKIGIVGYITTDTAFISSAGEDCKHFCFIFSCPLFSGHISSCCK